MVPAEKHNLALSQLGITRAKSHEIQQWLSPKLSSFGWFIDSPQGTGRPKNPLMSTVVDKIIERFDTDFNCQDVAVKRSACFRIAQITMRNKRTRIRRKKTGRILKKQSQAQSVDLSEFSSSLSSIDSDEFAGYNPEDKIGEESVGERDRERGTNSSQKEAEDHSDSMYDEGIEGNKAGEAKDTASGVGESGDGETSIGVGEEEQPECELEVEGDSNDTTESTPPATIPAIAHPSTKTAASTKQITRLKFTRSPGTFCTMHYGWHVQPAYYYFSEQAFARLLHHVQVNIGFVAGSETLAYKDKNGQGWTVSTTSQMEALIVARAGERSVIELAIIQKEG